MSNFIDAVFTWVDGNDPKWESKKEFYFSREQNADSKNEANADSRYIESNEIYYSIHLLRKNAPWIRTIYLVTDDQRPVWLTDTKALELGVVVVDHVEIFGEYKDSLPVFNSISIEMMIGHIKGLSEKFIYFNDDVMLIRPVEVTDFFEGASLVVRARLRFNNKLLDKVYLKYIRIKKGPEINKGGYVGRLPVRARPDRLKTYIELAHTGHPIFKKDYLKHIDSDFIASNRLYRFRHGNQVPPITYVINQIRLFRKVIVRDSEWRSFYAEDIVSGRGNMVISPEDLIGVKVVCFNDLSKLSTEALVDVHRLLDKFLYA